MFVELCEQIWALLASRKYWRFLFHLDPTKKEEVLYVGLEILDELVESLLRSLS